MKAANAVKNLASHQKKWYAKWHVYAGLIAGAFIFIMSLTGAILVFRFDIDKALNPDIFNIEVQGATLSPGEIIDKLERENDGWKISFLDIPQREGVWPYTLLRQGSEDYIYVDPYTGEITGIRDYHRCFIGVVEHIHRYMLVDDAGKYVTGISSLMLVILLVTGLRLWIPKKWKQLKSRLSINFKNSPKRVNWDLHNTLGFYFSPAIILIALSGFIITFAKYLIPLLLLLSFEKPKSMEAILKQESVFQSNAKPLAVDSVVKITQSLVPGGSLARIALPKDSVGVFMIRIIGKNELPTGDLIQIAVDQYAGKVVFNSATDVPELTKVYTNWIAPLHFGTLGGLSTMVLNLVASLVTASLFVTGFIIWFFRGKKKKEKVRHAQNADLEEAYHE